MELQVIQNKIYEVRGQKIMLDFDLATLYGVETRTINQAVKRNIVRFPGDFMFQLNAQEWEDLMRSQIVIASCSPENIDNQQDLMRSQFVTASDPLQIINNQQNTMSSQFVISSKRNKIHLPYAFTEHGVTMLASVLRSEKAVKMSIAVVRAFITLKQLAIRQNDIATQLQEMRDRLGEHDVQLNGIYDAIEKLLDEKTEQQKWEDRPRIGFKK